MVSVYTAHGYRFTIEADEPGLLAAADVLTDLAGEPADVDAHVSTYRLERRSNDVLAVVHDGRVIGTRLSPAALLLLLQWHVNQQAIARAVTRTTTFHAAAVESPGGTGVLLAAPMESGKTTTCSGLLRSGWGYLTDEAAACEPDGTVHAYPKPLTLDEGSWPLFPDVAPDDSVAGRASWLVPARRLGGHPLRRSRIGLLVFPGYAAGAATRAEPMRASEAALELAHSTFQFDEHGARDLACVSALARSVPAYRLPIGNLDAAVHTITELARECEVAA